MPPVTDSCLRIHNLQRSQKRHDRPIIERNTGHQILFRSRRFGRSSYNETVKVWGLPDMIRQLDSGHIRLHPTWWKLVFLAVMFNPHDSVFVINYEVDIHLMQPDCISVAPGLMIFSCLSRIMA
jgi:hypothetical protein